MAVEVTVDTAPITAPALALKPLLNDLEASPPMLLAPKAFDALALAVPKPLLTSLEKPFIEGMTVT